MRINCAQGSKGVMMTGMTVEQNPSCNCHKVLHNSKCPPELQCHRFCYRNFLISFFFLPPPPTSMCKHRNYITITHKDTHLMRTRKCFIVTVTNLRDAEGTCPTGRFAMHSIGLTFKLRCFQQPADRIFIFPTVPRLIIKFCCMSRMTYSTPAEYLRLDVQNGRRSYSGLVREAFFQNKYTININV